MFVGNSFSCTGSASEKVFALLVERAASDSGWILPSGNDSAASVSCGIGATGFSDRKAWPVAAGSVEGNSEGTVRVEFSNPSSWSCATETSTPPVIFSEDGRGAFSARISAMRVARDG